MKPKISILLSLALTQAAGAQGLEPPAVPQAPAFSDSVLCTYSIDELVRLRERYSSGTEMLLAKRAKLVDETIAAIRRLFVADDTPPHGDRHLMRLGQLYYEKSSSEFATSLESDSTDCETCDESHSDGPDFTESIALFLKLSASYPNSPLAASAWYNTGFLREEMGQKEEALLAYEKIALDYPQSPLVPDALMRIAEHYFNPPVNDLDRAIAYYEKILLYKESALYDAALYRLGWAYYKLSDYPKAIAHFTFLVDDIEMASSLDPEAKHHFPAVYDEAIEYIGLSFLDFGGPERAVAYFDEIGQRAFSYDVLKVMGDNYLTAKEEFANAAKAYAALLKMHPDSEDAPMIQAKIVEAYQHLRDSDMAYEERSELATAFSDATDWWEYVDDSSRLTARQLSEKAMRENIFSLLRRAAEDSIGTQYFARAVADSRKYLEAFPADSHAVRIHWNMALTLDSKLNRRNEAFAEFVKVSNLYPESEFQKQGAQNAISVADELVRSSATSEATATDEIALTPEEENLVFALNNFIKLFPNDPESPKILQRAGVLYYDKKDFRESLKYFKTLVKHYPESQPANEARFAALESYFGKEDYESAEIAARRLRELSPEHSDKAEKRLVQSIFLNAQAHANRDEHVKAASEFMRVIEEVPDAEFADLALFNAGISYEKHNAFDHAVAAYERLLRSYPRSDSRIASLNNLAFDYRELGHLTEAANTYERLALIQPDTAKQIQALHNAGVTYVEAKQWQEAIRVNKTSVQRFPDASGAQEKLFANAQYHLELGDKKGAADVYQAFVAQYPGAPQVIEAHFKLGDFLYGAGEHAVAMKHFDLAVQKHDALESAWNSSGSFYASEALFKQMELKLADFQEIRFQLPEKALRANVEKKKRLLTEIVDGYAKVAGYGTIRVYEATYKISYAYELFADAWAAQEIAAKDPNHEILARNRIHDEAAELYLKSIESYKNGIAGLRNLTEKLTQNESAVNEDEPLALPDSSRSVADRWLRRCRDKVSQNYHQIAELHRESLDYFLAAPTPAGLSTLESLIYQQQVIEKAVQPALRKVKDAHAMNIAESARLALDNEWVDNSKTKVLQLGQIIPGNLQKLADEAIRDYGRSLTKYDELVLSGAEAFEVADTLANLLDLQGRFTMSAASGLREHIEQVKSLAILTQDVLAREQDLSKHTLKYDTILDSLALQTFARRQYFEKKYAVTEEPNYEDAAFTYDDFYFSLRDGAEKLLRFTAAANEELHLDNYWTHMVGLALLRTRPEEFAAQYGLTVQDTTLVTSSDWLASAMPEPGWMQAGYVDSTWSPAYREGKGERVRGCQKIWLTLFDEERIAELDSNRIKNAVSGKNAPVELAQIVNRPAQVYFRKKVDLTSLPVSGTLKAANADSMELYVNGYAVHFVTDYPSPASGIQSIDISPYLKPGSNVVAIKVNQAETEIKGFEAELALKKMPGWAKLNQDIMDEFSPERESTKEQIAE
jgi:tetratricopeptide (TPR) repeat protein